MTRNTPPARRPHVTVETDRNGHPISVTVGLDPDTAQPIDVFADTTKGGQMAATVADACVVISIAMQHGVAVAELGKSLAREPDLMRGGDATLAASPIGVIVEVIAGLAKKKPASD